MHKKFNYPYGLSLALACTGIIMFTYMAFLGLLFHYEGAMLEPLLMSVVGLAILGWSLVVMCRSKRSRQWRSGMLREVLASLAALGVLGLGSVPVARFLSICEQQVEVRQAVGQTTAMLSSMPQAYEAYVDKRIEAYRARLLTIAPGSPLYRQAIAGAGGSDRDQKVGYLCASLRRRIYPPGIDEVFSARRHWLQDLPPFNVWNVFAARNVRIVGEAGREWGSALQALSVTSYLADDAGPFGHVSLTDRLESFRDEYTSYCLPGWRGMLAIILCFILVLLPYWNIRRPANGITAS